jgi:hypothetical protein
MLEQKLQEELNRYRAINKYGKKLIMEQDVPPAPEAPAEDPAAAPTDAPLPDAPTDAPAPDLGGGGGDLPPAPDAPLDAPAPDMGGGDAPLNDTPADTTEELDITDLVDMTQSIKKDIESNKNDHGTVLQKMDDVFSKLDDLESKLGEMNQLVAKIDELGAKVQEMKPKTEVEKLEMRSLDSYPFNQKPQEFFAQKQGEMRASGKNEYVLTKDEVNNYPTDEIKSSFNPEQEEDEFKF